jgi:hypothetical protein
LPSLREEIAQAITQSTVAATNACKALIEQNNRDYVDKKIRDIKIDGLQIKPNTTPSTAIKDDTLHLTKFKYLQSDFASFFAVETNTLLADWIKTGHLNTQDVEIYAGDNLRFLINGDGIFGFHSPSAGVIDTSNYVQFSEAGVRCVKENIPLIELDWNGMRFKELVGNEALESLIADSTGKLWLKRTLTVGDSTLPYGSIIIDGESGTIGSGKYSSGELGAGWQISRDGSANFNNINARGTLSSVVFKHNQISGMGGSFLVAPVLTLGAQSPMSAVTHDTETYYQIAVTFQFDGETHIANGISWNVGDIVSIQGVVEVSDNAYEVRDLRMKLAEFTETGCIFETLSKSDDCTLYKESDGSPYDTGSIDLGGGMLLKLASVMFLGTLAEDGSLLRKGIFLSVEDSNGPYLDVYDSTGANSMPKVRIGNLDGIENDSLRENPSGYGAYLENAYVVGQIVSNKGKIGGMNLDEHTLSTIDGKNGIADADPSSPAGDVVFWAGSDIPIVAPYRVKKDGSIFIGNDSGDHLSFDGEDLEIEARSIKLVTDTSILTLGDALQSIDDQISDLNTSTTELKSLVYLDGDGVNVTAPGFLAKTVVSTDGLHIKDNTGAETTYFTEGKAYIKTAEITNQLVISGLVADAREDGRITWRKV